jgi:hypothetical protein
MKQRVNKIILVIVSFLLFIDVFAQSEVKNTLRIGTGIIITR